MKTLDDQIAEYLAQAAASGELARASNYGKPFRDDDGWAETPTALRMPFRILKNAGGAPPEIELFHQRAALRQQIASAADAASAAELRKQLNELEQMIALRLEALARNARG